MPLLAAFVLTPLVELYLLIEIGSVLGALPTIGLCLLTAVVGASLLRQQGIETLARARRNLDRGELPAIELFEAVALVIGGVLLLTPGLVTDVIGFACLVPASRRWLVGVMMRRMRVRYGPVSTQAGRGDPAEPEQYLEGEVRRRDED